ncbi:MAG: bifunctional 3,4-dihydroxy-2-butanone-4-phosphate synthase/GTP cyclohydrolase II [Victivallaceae bacterium]
MDGFSSLGDVLEALNRGDFILIVDDPNRENEGDLMIAAEKVTTEKMSFLLQHTSGVVCTAMDAASLKRLEIPLMVPESSDRFKTRFTISVDAAKGVTTGVSASDRGKTARLLADPESLPVDFVRPGHLFPLKATEGGVLKRTGHTEAAVDLTRLAGINPCCVIAEVVNPDYSIARLDDLRIFSRQYSIPITSIDELVRFRRKSEVLVKRISSSRLPTRFGEFIIHVYESLIDNVQHLAVVKGDVYEKQNVMVRVHSECLTGDILLSTRCDCGNQLESSLQIISNIGGGVVVYLRGQEGRGIGLGHKIQAYALQDLGLDTVEANLELGLLVDSREYGIGAQILADLGLTTIRLLTNNPAKYSGLSGFGLKIVERVALPVVLNDENTKYLETKKNKLGHWLNI